MLRLTQIRKLGALALLGLAALTAAQSANAAPAWSLNAPANFRNDTWSFGDLFTVGGSDISVTGLGAFDANRDGFVTPGGIPVGIFRESDDTLLASTSVLSADPLTGNYRFHAISALTLSANTAYRVVAVNRDDEYNLALSPPDNVDPSITWNGYGYCGTAALTSCDVFTGSEGTWMANFIIHGSSVPEPGVLALLGVAFAGLGFARRRKK